MKKIGIAILLLLAGKCMYCQSARASLSAPYTSIGIYSKHFTDAFSGAINQAALAQATTAAAGVYGERKFMLKELSNYTASIVLPSAVGGFGIAAAYFGGATFNHSQLGVAYGRTLSPAIDIGVQFNYNNLQLQGYGGSSTLNFEAGAIFHLTEKIHLGIHVYNPAGGKFGKLNNEKLAAIYTTGLGYEISDKVFISTEINKEENQPVAVNTGLQYIFARQFFARLGIGTGTGNYFFGLGVQWKTCRVDITSSWQAQPGFTPGIMLLFNFHENKTAEQ